MNAVVKRTPRYIYLTGAQGPRPRRVMLLPSFQDGWRHPHHAGRPGYRNSFDDAADDIIDISGRYATLGAIYFKKGLPMTPGAGNFTTTHIVSALFKH